MKCYIYYNKQNKQCDKKSCRYWIKSKENSNCCVTAAKKGNKTLEDIGKIYNITRMRVCQIEKKIIAKIKKRVNETLS
jgi:DNA-directed RNA polymerase specialized sigma subunit